MFDKFTVWFVPTVSPSLNCVLWWFSNLSYKEPNNYKLKSTVEAVFRGLKFATFSSSDPDKYPLPKREYLGFHILCAEVANKAGLCARK